MRGSRDRRGGAAGRRASRAAPPHASPAPAPGLAPGPAFDAAHPFVRYAEAHSSAPPRAVAAADVPPSLQGRATMHAGATVGRLLATLTAIVRPRLAVDVGTFTGYSALSIAEALPPRGRVVTCEIDPAIATVARRHIERSPYRDRVDLRVGDALATLRALRGPIGLAFIDADKQRYWDYYDAIVERLAPHGIVVVDNTLLFGTVALSDAAARGLPPALQASRAAVLAFNRRVLADPRTECVLLPVRDGVTLVRRRASAAARAPQRRRTSRARAAGGFQPGASGIGPRRKKRSG